MLDYDMRKLHGEHRTVQKEIDEQYIAYFQEQYDKHELQGNKREANRAYWVLLLVDRLEEAGYEWQEIIEEKEELEQYIEDNVTPDNTAKHHWYNR